MSVSCMHGPHLDRTEERRRIALGKETMCVTKELCWERVACNQGSHEQALSEHQRDNVVEPEREGQASPENPGRSFISLMT